VSGGPSEPGSEGRERRLSVLRLIVAAIVGIAAGLLSAGLVNYPTPKFDLEQAWSWPVFLRSMVGSWSWVSAALAVVVFTVCGALAWLAMLLPAAIKDVRDRQRDRQRWLDAALARSDEPPQARRRRFGQPLNWRWMQPPKPWGGHQIPILGASYQKPEGRATVLVAAGLDSDATVLIEVRKFAGTVPLPTEPAGGLSGP
jgi:hypothetical protein